MRIRTLQSCTIILGFVLIIISASDIAPPRVGVAANSLSLSVTIQSRHIPHFEVCLPVKVNEPFRVAWGNGNVKDSVSGVLHEPEGEGYPITLNILEGGGNCQQMRKPKLQLGEAEEWSAIMSLAFNHIDNGKVVLSRGSCP
jgi:hypothetical protein